MACLGLAPLAHAATPPQDGMASLRAEAHHYAQVAGLPPLDPHASFEIRYWGYGYMGGNVTGIIVSGGQLRLFTTRSTYKDGHRHIRHAQLDPPVPIDDVPKLKSLVTRLEPLNGSTVECPRFDGGENLIDAVVDGRTIRLKGINTFLPCSKKNAQLIFQLAMALGDDAATLCLNPEEATHPKPWITGFWRPAQKPTDDEDVIIVFRQNGTLVYYDSDYDSFYPQSTGHYTVDGDHVRITITSPPEKPKRMTVDANRARTRFVLSDPATKEHATFTRMAGKACVTQRDLRPRPRR